MRLRQEKVVCLLAVLLLGFLVWRGIGSGAGATSSRRQRRATPPEMQHHPAPDVARALPRPGRDPSALVRPLLEPPRDTVPLPPLEFVPPPTLPLAGLRPPGVHGPAPRQFPELLRAPRAASVARIDGVFVDDVEFDTEAGSEGLEQLSALDVDDASLTPEERMERIASYRRFYDWIKTPGYHWGQITNGDRFGLGERDQEPILWVEFDPSTGQPRFAGQPPVPIPRERVDEFGFSETPENQLELERREFAGPVSAGRYPALLAFANRCSILELEVSNALRIAEEMYKKAQPISGGDPAPWLGLARCYEAGFQFEAAFDVYRELLAGDYAESPEVLAHLARLEARFRLYRRADEHFALAERFGRNEWISAWQHGRYDLDRGQISEALERLGRASRFEPQAVELGPVRANIRADHGHAWLAAGDLGQASSWYTKALQAEPGHEAAQAGLLTVAYIAGADETNGDGALLTEGGDSAGFEQLVAAGLAAMGRGEYADAREKLDLAAEIDPLRGYVSWRALSFLAELTGYPEEASRYAELAFENDPTDVYTLVRRGRVLLARDDLQGALACFTRALDLELEQPDVLASMGEIELRLGNHERAELFLERSLFLDEKVSQVHTLRGMNQLFLGRTEEAEQSFSRARNLDRTDPVAKIGLAWCAYSDGDSVEAQTLLRELDDERRALEEDPYRDYANAQIERIADHEEKVVWSDRFERQQLQNNWSVEGVDTGVEPLMKDGAVLFEGTFRKTGKARIKRKYASGDFVSVEAKVLVDPGSRVRVGLSVSLEQLRRGAWDLKSEVSLSRHQDGMLQTRFMRSGQDDIDYTDVQGFPWKAGEPVVLRLERYGESSDTRFRLEVDGIPVLEDVPVPTLGRTSGEVWVSLFVEGEPGRPVNATFDDVEIVKRDR